MSEINKVDKPIKFHNHWVCDFETIVEETIFFQRFNKTGLTYGYLEHMESGFNYEFCKVSDLIDFFKLNRLVNQYVYFHNLSFDGVFILDWLGRNGYKLVDDDQDVKPNMFGVFRSTGNKIYKIVVGYKNRRNQHSTITFLCSKLLLSSSVESLGKAIGVDKYEFGGKNDPNFHIREPMSDVKAFYDANTLYCNYCRNDVRIVKKSLREFWTGIYEFLKEYKLESEFKKCIKQPTISSLSFLLQKLVANKLHLMEENYLYINNYNDRRTMDRFTNGGLTICNEKYLEKRLENVNGIIIDLKSAYPAIMSDKLPYGEMLKEPPLNCDYCCFVEVYYDHIQANNHTIPLLKRWDKIKLNQSLYMLSADKYTTYLLEEEMEQIEKMFTFKGKKILNRYYFRLSNYLSEFVEKMFYYKELYKKNNPAKSHTFKILLNSGYGIHAKRFDFKTVSKEKQGEDIYSIGKKFYERNTIIDLNKESRHSYIPNNRLVALNPIKMENWTLFNHKAIANYITAKTRIKLMKGMQYFGSDNFLYCDTDSLFLINVPIKKVEQYCGNKLGDWEIEDKQFFSAIVLRSKLYELRDKEGNVVKVGSAGVKKGIINYYDLAKERHLNIKDANIIPYRVKGGIILRSVSKILSLIEKEGVADSKLIDYGEWNKDFENFLKEKGWT